LTGVPQDEFANVCLKEVIDNALDACEIAGAALEISAHNMEHPVEVGAISPPAAPTLHELDQAGTVGESGKAL
jgi:hypothetical protein